MTVVAQSDEGEEAVDLFPPAAEVGAAFVLSWGWCGLCLVLRLVRPLSCAVVGAAFVSC